MDIKEALSAISTGHTIWSVDYAREVCEAFKVSFPKSLIQVYESDTNPKGVTMYHGPEEGVWSLSLSHHVASCLGVLEEAHGYFGRGSQAREYARVVALKLGITTE